MHKWIDYEIANPDHVADLERAAAMCEQKLGMARPIAESHAYIAYLRTQYAKGAAHHLMGMIKAKEVGNVKDSEKHYTMYNMHVNALGLNPLSPVSPEVLAYKKEEEHYDGYQSCESDSLFQV